MPVMYFAGLDVEFVDAALLVLVVEEMLARAAGPVADGPDVSSDGEYDL